ncbi:MAG: hypothetical protein H6623_08110 [Bdellovibrionaceae bacterium]|nr:hypothetical protein [Pseudobdellovibrionaceae bacterium]
MKKQFAAETAKSIDPADLITPSGDITPDPEPEYKTSLSVNPLVANRVLMVNYFRSIFGEGATVNANLLIGRQAMDFGSSYTVYDRVITADCNKKKDSFTACAGNESMTLTAPPNLGINIRREAWRLRMCHLSVKYLPVAALRKIDPKANLENVPNINEENIKKVFSLFFRARPTPGSEILDALLITAQDGKTPLEQWQNILLSICISPHWQVL